MSLWGPRSHTIAPCAPATTSTATTWRSSRPCAGTPAISNKRLAETVGLAPSTCLERVRRLVELGVLRGFHADLDLAPLDMGMQAMIAVRMREHSRELVDSFRAYALTLPQVLGVFHVSGADDFLVHVGVRDAQQLRDLALDAFTTRPEVDRIETRLIFEHMSSWTPAGPPPAPGVRVSRRPPAIRARFRARGACPERAALQRCESKGPRSRPPASPSARGFRTPSASRPRGSPRGCGTGWGRPPRPSGARRAFRRGTR